MSNQPENEASTPQELRQFILSTLETSQQALVDLSDEELEAIVGGGGCISCSAKPESPVGVVYVGKLGNYRSKGIKASYLAQRDVKRSPVRSAYNALRYGGDLGEKLNREYDIHYTSAMRSKIRENLQDQ
jgi:hypothetical protein